jgi:hypothetical protein
MRTNYTLQKGVVRIRSKVRKYTNRFTVASAALIGILGIALMPAASAASGYALYDDAQYVSPGNASNTAVQLSYVSGDATQTDGGVDFTVPSDLTVSSLNNLSTDFKFTEGTCSQASPRFQINVDGHNVFAYLGAQFPSTNPCAGMTYSNSTNVISSTSMVDATQLGNGYETWGQFQSQHSTDAVTGVQLVVDGFTADNIVAQFDNTMINDTLYDYEPTTPAAADACKNSGWMNVTDNNGGSFKNQGDCVSWVQHNVNGHGTPANGKH